MSCEEEMVGLWLIVTSISREKSKKINQYVVEASCNQNTYLRPFAIVDECKLVAEILYEATKRFCLGHDLVVDTAN